MSRRKMLEKRRRKEKHKMDLWDRKFVIELTPAAIEELRAARIAHETDGNIRNTAGAHPRDETMCDRSADK